MNSFTFLQEKNKFMLRSLLTVFKYRMQPGRQTIKKILYYINRKLPVPRSISFTVCCNIRDWILGKTQYREYLMIYRGQGFLAVAWFGSFPTPSTPLPSVFLSVACVLVAYWLEWGKSQFIWRWEAWSSINHLIISDSVLVVNKLFMLWLVQGELIILKQKHKF